MEQSPTGCWTNHHSLVQYKGQWYLFYHHNDYSPEFDKNRSVRIDSLSFNADGTIRQVIPTLRGVGLTDARRNIQIDRYSARSGEEASIDFLNPERKFDGWKTLSGPPRLSPTWVTMKSISIWVARPAPLSPKERDPGFFGNLLSCNAFWTKFSLRIYLFGFLSKPESGGQMNKNLIF